MTALDIVLQRAGRDTVLQRADGMEEAEGNNVHWHLTLSYMHMQNTHIHTWLTTDLCTHQNTHTFIQWLKMNVSVDQLGIRNTLSVQHQRFWPHVGQKGISIRQAVWVGLALLLPVGWHRGTKRAQLHLLHKQDLQPEMCVCNTWLLQISPVNKTWVTLLKIMHADTQLHWLYFLDYHITP